MNLQITKCNVLAQSCYSYLMDLQAAISNAKVQESEITMEQQLLDSQILCDKTRQIVNRAITIFESALVHRTLAKAAFEELESRNKGV